MCSNYAPSAREQLLSFGRPAPDFAYGEAYPGRVAPILNIRSHLRLFDPSSMVAFADPR